MPSCDVFMSGLEYSCLKSLHILNSQISSIVIIRYEYLRMAPLQH